MSKDEVGAPLLIVGIVLAGLVVGTEWVDRVDQTQPLLPLGHMGGGLQPFDGDQTVGGFGAPLLCGPGRALRKNGPQRSAVGDDLLEDLQHHFGISESKLETTGLLETDDALFETLHGE